MMGAESRWRNPRSSEIAINGSELESHHVHIFYVSSSRPQVAPLSRCFSYCTHRASVVV